MNRTFLKWVDNVAYEHLPGTIGMSEVTLLKIELEQEEDGR